MERLEIYFFEFNTTIKEGTKNTKEVFIKIGKNDLEKFLATKDLRKDKKILLEFELTWYKFVDYIETEDNFIKLHFSKTIWPKENDNIHWVYNYYSLGKKIDYIWFLHIKND